MSQKLNSLNKFYVLLNYQKFLTVKIYIVFECSSSPFSEHRTEFSSQFRIHLCESPQSLQDIVGDVFDLNREYPRIIEFYKNVYIEIKPNITILFRSHYYKDHFRFDFLISILKVGYKLGYLEI